MAATAHPSPCLVVIFGASGDLTSRKLIPALYDLWSQKHASEFAVLGVSRSAMTDDQFREKISPHGKQFAHGYTEEKWRDFMKRVHYHSGDSTKEEDFPALKQRIEQLSVEHKTGENILFYLSLSPALYDATIVNIGSSGLLSEGKNWCSLNRLARPWQRLIIEKPFGNDPESSAHLNRVLGRVTEEENIYRIDHYLGKETVQNLLVMRFANSIFEPIWNRHYIDHVQITAAETVGVEGRGGYYDSPAGGAMRDMIQSHLVQVMAVAAMEPPVSNKADDIRAEKRKILAATRIPKESEISNLAVRGQYGPGQFKGAAVPGYREEKGVNPKAQTDTYAAVKVFVDTWRWEGVPFYLRSGKRMAKKLTEIVIYFRPTPHTLFRSQQMKPNQIVINVQPDEGMRIRFEGKVPGQGMNIKSVVMDFDYVKQFQAEPPEAYATLILDAMRGDLTLYKHKDEIEDAWRPIQPVLDYWKENPDEELPNYAAGTWGPSASDVMMARDGRHWHNV